MYGYRTLPLLLGPGRFVREVALTAFFHQLFYELGLMFDAVRTDIRASSDIVVAHQSNVPDKLNDERTVGT